MNISSNEWLILEALWKEKPLTLKQLCDGVGKKHDWTKHAVISTLKRMTVKGSINVEQTEERKYFYPAIEEQEAITLETDALTDKVYGGSKLLLVSSIVGKDSFSDSEVDELIAILEKRKG